MFISAFAISVGCDATILVIYLQEPGNFGGTSWLTIKKGNGYAEELVDIVWLALLRVVFLLPHVLPFLRRRRLARPFLPRAFVTLNYVLLAVKAITLLVAPPSVDNLLAWWIMLVLSVASVVAQRACLHHLRSSYAQARYKTIFIGSRLDARLLEREPDYEADGGGEGVDGIDLETGVGSGEENSGPREGTLESRKLKSLRRMHLARAQSRGRQESTRELVDYFAARMQQARDAWLSRVEALQRRWRTSILNVDWLGRGNLLSEKEEALRLTFGLIVRMFAYEDALDDLRLAAQQEPSCLEFFAPQIASFLLFDSYYMSGQLEEWLLARCSENLYFAHSFEFQLRAICLPVTSGGHGVSADTVGGMPSPEETKSGRDMDDSAGSRRRGRDRRGSSGFGSGGSVGGSRGESDDEGVVIDRVGRRAVGLLLGEIAQRGEIAARRLVSSESMESSQAQKIPGASKRNGRYGEASALASSSPEVMAMSGMGGAAGAEEEGRVTNEDEIGVEFTAPAAEIPLYHEAPNFVFSLTTIAASLTPLSRAERTPTLKKQLEEVGQKCLGARARVQGGQGLVYVPLGNRRHRVVAVHPAESFAFSTRERAPCFVCLEVINSTDDMEQVESERTRRGGMFDAGIEGESSARLGALWQWLPARLRSPTTAGFRRTFRFPGGQEWTLSSEARGYRNGRKDMGVEALEDETAGADNDDGDGEVARLRANRSLSTERRQGEEVRGEAPAEGLEERYRLMSEGSLQTTGEGSRLALSDAKEWWAEGSGDVWGGRVEERGHPSSGGGNGRSDGNVEETGVERRGSSGVVPQLQSAHEGVPDFARSAGGVGGDAIERGEATEGKTRGLGEDRISQVEEEEKRPRPQVLFNELWKDKSDRVRRVSPWAGERGWRLLPIIVKANDDLRQEQLASQLLHTMRRILRAEGVRVWLRPYDITPLTADSGIIEAVEDTISLDALFKYRKEGRVSRASVESEDLGGPKGVGESGSSRFSLMGFFEARFGPKGSDGFKQAQRRFIESLAAYSIACYLLQIKDRHNGNILLDAQGRLIHVDFGFMLANSPGGNLGFESAPFKLTPGFMEVMGGTRSRCFRDFRGLCIDTYLALRRNSQEIVLLVEMMASGNEALPCFQGPGGGAAAAADLAARFQPDLNDPACEDFVHKLVQQSVGNWRTDWFNWRECRVAECQVWFPLNLSDLCSHGELHSERSS